MSNLDKEVLPSSNVWNDIESVVGLDPLYEFKFYCRFVSEQVYFRPLAHDDQHGLNTEEQQSITEFLTDEMPDPELYCAICWHDEKARQRVRDMHKLKADDDNCNNCT